MYGHISIHNYHTHSHAHIITHILGVIKIGSET